MHLRSFLEVHQRGTVVAAATALGYTPPAVTQQLAKLERGLGVSLFDRAGGRLAVTDAGRALAPVAQEMLNLAAHAADVVQQTPPRQHVVISGIASALSAIVVPSLPQLRELADIILVEAEDADALRELRLGHVEIAMIQEYPGDEAARDERLNYHLVAADDLRFVLPPSWPSSTRLRDLQSLPWLVNGTGTRCETATKRVLREADLVASISADISDNDLLLRLVSEGYGATIVPDLVLGETDAEVTIANEHIGISRTLLAVTRQRPTMATAAIIAELQ
ncbi:MAG TPA: LysR family transcriptional regulator [Acidimicrobiales bacterium]|nr:LysR family transcriptional regulator [Acidimicrobiales bacterium]